MPISTLGQLMHWLLQTPRTPLETLRATQATPEDLAAAISQLMAANLVCEPVLVGGKMLFRLRNAPQNHGVLAEPIAGSHQRNPYRDQHRMQPWIDVAVREAAREWKSAPGAAGDDAATAVRAEAFLAAKLGRRASDREARVFWAVVEGWPEVKQTSKRGSVWRKPRSGEASS